MAEGAKDETDGDKTERKGQTECLMRFEQTVPAGVCQQADMQIIFFFSPPKSPDVSKAEVTGLFVCVVFL